MRSPGLLARGLLVVGLTVGRLLAGGTAAKTVPVSFRNDVLPILSKAGCNSGGCHGALAGKGGFRLSLFAYNPEADHFAITRESLGRRIESSTPGLSLLLTKPTTLVRHKGGKRLAPDSADYHTLARWIAQGAPGPRADEPALESLEISPLVRTVNTGEVVRVTVQARYSDGRVRDVTPWARFTSTDETVASVDSQGRATILGPGQGAITAWYSSRIVLARLTSPYSNTVPAAAFAAVPRTNFIDARVVEQLERLHLQPSPTASDATFVRRAFLDTIGRLPTPEEVREFEGDSAADRYARLADRLLERPEFVDYWAYKWSDVLLVTGARLRPESVRAYYDWIRSRVAANTPWDRLVRELITAKGSAGEDGASNFYAVHQDPEAMAENVSQAFLALSINCARCHNHPLEKWTNDQYYQFANLFARVRAKGWGGDARSGDGRRTLFVQAAGDLIQPRTGRPQPPAPLDGAPIAADDPRDRREQLADWLTSPSNPYFARAAANRVWANFFGSGVVEPVDDLRASNPAANEPLLAELAAHLVRSGFNLRDLMRQILTSHTYRRSTDVLPGNRDDRRHYSRFFPRRLSAEVLSDAIADVTGVPDRFTELALNDGSTEATSAYTNVVRSLQLADASVKSYFLKTFGRNQREITCECERSNQPSLVQALHLSNGATLNDKIAAPAGRLAQTFAAASDPAAWLNGLWTRCLGRLPTERERAAALEAFQEVPRSEQAKVAEDLGWSLLSSREFLFQH